MLAAQKSAIDCNIVELIETLKRETPMLLQYLESRGVISFEERELLVRDSLSAQTLTSLFYMLKAKDNGWSHILSYPRITNQRSLADKMENGATDNVTVETVSKKPKRSALAEFSIRLAQYYQLNYANIPTMGESPKHVKDAWVPLQIDGRNEDHLAADRINHVELLNRLQVATTRNVALIKGDPGMGKTTLARKIAYEWAVSYDSNQPQQFSLVLAVPLRSAGGSDRFDQLAIDYFLTIGGGQLVANIDKAKLICEIKQLQFRLLVILDGLDEYSSCKGSPFTTMFAAPFEQPSTDYNVPMIIPFKLIITSRPYACARINEEFFPLRFIILPLDANHLKHFVNTYCQTSHGVTKVNEYLKVNAKLVIQVPLILTFVCFLADSVEEIPTNMTCLYDSFIRQMLKREARQASKMEERIDIHKWKESTVVKTTARLAYTGCDEMEFTNEALEKCHVINDSFVCGFLLHKYYSTEDRLTAEFLHRSVQEFFVALHCYRMVLSGKRTKHTVFDLIRGNQQSGILAPLFADLSRMEEQDGIRLPRDSQVGRFFFGICSKEGRFDQLVNWLDQPLFYSARDHSLLSDMICMFGENLTDCSASDKRMSGQRLFDSIEGVYDYLMQFHDRVVCSPVSNIGFPIEFTEALHLVAHVHFWFLADNDKSARFLYACTDKRSKNLTGPQLDKVDILIWEYKYDIDDRKTLETAVVVVDRIKLLPPARTLVMSMLIAERCTVVNFCISYAHGLELEMTLFRIQYGTEHRDRLLSLVQTQTCVNLTGNERSEYAETRKRSKRVKFRQLNVTVNDRITQPTLIFSLIRLALI